MTVDIDRNEARRRLARLTYAQRLMIEYLAAGRTLAYIARRFNNCQTSHIARQLRAAQLTCEVEGNSELVALHRAWLQQTH